MGVNLALLGLENLRLDYTDPVATPAIAPNLVLSDVIEDSGYDLLSNEGKALQRALFLGEPEVPEPTISLKQFIESFIQATADVFEARGFNNIADHLRSIHNFDRIIGEIEMRITKYEEDSIAQIDAIERFLAIMPGVSSAVPLDADIEPQHVTETGTGAEVLASIDSKNSGTLKEWIQDLYVDLITDSMLAFDDSAITNPSGFDDGFGSLEDMKWVLETRNNEAVPAAGTLDRTLYDAVSSIQANWAVIYEKIQAGVSQWSDYNNMGDFSGFDFSRLINGQDFSDWTGSLISDWQTEIADTTLFAADYHALADSIRAKYEADLASNTHIAGFSSVALTETDMGGYFSPIPTDDPNEKILEVGKYYYNHSDGLFYTAVKDLTSGEVAIYDGAVSYPINSFVYNTSTNALYKATTNTTVGIDPTNTSQWKIVDFTDTSFWSLNADSSVQLSALTLGIEKMTDDLGDELSSNFVGDFSISENYSSDSLVYDGGEFYSLNSGENINHVGGVGDVTSYNRGDVVTVDGVDYISLVNHSAPQAYSGSDYYFPGDTVTDEGRIWQYMGPQYTSTKTPSSAPLDWVDVTDSTFGDTDKYLIYSGPIIPFWTYEPEKRVRINILRAIINSAMNNLITDLNNPPGALTDIRSTINAAKTVVQGELDYYDTMVDLIQSYIDSATDLSSATAMVEGILTELAPAVSGVVGSLGTGVADLDTWVTTMDSVSSESGFFEIAQDLSALVSGIKVMYDAYNASSSPTTEQVNAAKDAGESLRGDTGAMVDRIQGYIDSTVDLSTSTYMVESILDELEPTVSEEVGSLGTGVSDLDTWISTLNSVLPDDDFYNKAQQISDIVSGIKAIHEAYDSGSTPTSTQLDDTKELVEKLRTNTGSLTVNYVNYLNQWESIEDEFNALFPETTGEFNPAGTLQAQAISALQDLMVHVSDLEGLSSGGGDPLYADIYFSMKNTFETLLSNLDYRTDETGAQLARVVPVTGSGGMDEDAYFDAFRKILKHHSIPNSSAPLTLLYEYYIAIGDNGKADDVLNQMINGGSDLSSSANPGLLSRLKDEFKTLADGVYMPGTDKRNICTTNGNEQKFLHRGSMEAMRDVYNGVKDDIATLMNEIDTALTRSTIGDTSSARFVNVADLASIEGGRADGVKNFSDNASNFDIARELSEFDNYGSGSDARKYHASIATASTSLMSILSNFEFFFNGEMRSDDGIWGSHVSTKGTPYAFTQHGKMNGRMQEQAYVYDYSKVLTNAKKDLGAKFDSKATWIMDDLLDMVEKGYDKAKDYYRDDVVGRADNYWVEFNAFHLAVETEARRLVTSAFATTTPMEDVFYSVFESDDLTADEKRLLSKVLNMLMTLLVSMLGSNQEVRDVVQSLQRGESTLAQVSESIQITESMANNMIERAMAMAADMLDQEKDSLQSSGNYIGSDPISSQQYLDMASFYLGNVELNEALEQANEEQERLEV